MPTLFLRERETSKLELMEDPHCDAEKLLNTYKHFEVINRFVAAWRQIYVHCIRPLNPKTLLDIGCGGGDVARTLARWAKRDGLNLHITAIDPNNKALEYANSQKNPSTVLFQKALSSELVSAKERFDVVISNHVLHHLASTDLLALCSDSKQLASKRVIHNDLRRSDLAYLGFNLTWPFFLNSFITPDGLLSIKRSYTHKELEAVAPEDWQVKPLIPYRNLLLYHHD